MGKVCDQTSVGQEIRRGPNVVMIARHNYPEAYALPAGHCDGDEALTAAAKESREEVGIEIIDNRLVWAQLIDNPCKREGGFQHAWQFFRAVEWTGEVKAGSDAKVAFWASPFDLRAFAERTEYFMKKYNIPYAEVGKLTVAIFGKDPAKKETDPEWKSKMGLEPAWYYILKCNGII